jgi:hypothetical protein
VESMYLLSTAEGHVASTNREEYTTCDHSVGLALMVVTESHSRVDHEKRLATTSRQSLSLSLLRQVTLAKPPCVFSNKHSSTL